VNALFDLAHSSQILNSNELPAEAKARENLVEQASSLLWQPGWLAPTRF
jgi:hypothetical protein